LEKEQKIYESTFIVNAALDDAQIDVVIEKVKDIIVKNGGEIRSTEKWGRKRLAYTIDKKNNGFYTFLEFKAPADLLLKLERHFHLEEQVIRHLTIQLDKKALKAREIAAAAQKLAAAAQAVSEVVV
jgi:small subunit ribosomal protein S6